MLNLRINSHRTHEDYVAVQHNTGVLPISGQHFVGILSVCVISIICALPVGNLIPLSIEAIPALASLNKGVSSNNEENYLKGSDEETAANLQITADAGSRENYDDADLPSNLFSSQAVNDAVIAARRSGNNLADAFNDEDADNTDDLAGDMSDEMPAVPEQLRQRFYAGSTSVGADTSDSDESVNENDSAPVTAGANGVSMPPQAKPLPALNGPDKTLELLADGSIPQVSGLDTTRPPVLNAYAAPRPTGRWYKQTVHSGDTISAIFNYLNLPDGTLADITKAASKADLYLKPGTQIHFLIDSKNNVLELVKPLRSNDEQVRFTRMSPSAPFSVVHEDLNAHVDDNKAIKLFADAEKMPNAVEAAKERKAAQEEALKQKQAEELLAKQNARTRPRLVVSDIRRGENFNAAAKRAGLTAQNVAQIRSVLNGRVNVRRLNAGDGFRVLFNGIGTRSAITALEFNTSRNGRVRLYRNPDNGTFYEEDGYRPVTGSFRRFPVSGNLEVSSPFNPRRYHPLRHRISPHNGVDFRMPIGTPVYAPADGVVTYAGYMRGGGYTVVIKHMGAYSTVYMHLSRYNVSKGDTVHMGQVFAKSGNTGGSTGSHLHYEIRINDRPVDPLKVDLPSGNPALASQRRERFKSTVQVLKSELYKDSLAVRVDRDANKAKN